MGFKSYYISSKAGDDVSKEASLNRLKDDSVGFEIDPKSGLLVNIEMNGKSVPVDQRFFYYEGAVGDNKVPENRSSGAYIFRPKPGSKAVEVAEKTDFKVFKGALVAEVQQTFNEWVSQTIRVYSSENLVEFDWVVGPIPNK